MRAALVLTLALGVASSAAAQPPQATIREGRMVAKVYIPDPTRGFYRGTRFDWSGAIFDLEVAGHHLYRPWFSSVRQGVSDFVYGDDDSVLAGPNSAMTGPVEEFQKPIGYDTAKPGETFLKVGVGLLRKLDDQPYSFRTQFELVDPGVWKTTKTQHSITFEQTFGKPGSDFAYVYTKTIRLAGREDRMVIEHHLRNTGRLPLETTVYDHNFFTIDNQDVGAGYKVITPYDLKPDRPPDAAFCRIDGREVDYIADLHGKDRVMFGLQGFTDSAKDYDLHLRSEKSMFDVRIVGDRPLVNAVVWSIRPVIAVEPFLAVSAPPAQDFAWTYTYTYTALSKGHPATGKPTL